MSDPRAIDAVAQRTLPLDAKNLTLGGDVNLTTIWTDQAFACGLRNDGTTTGDISVVTISGASVIYHAVPAGGWIYGFFKTLVNATTTATAVIAEK